jgi:hypothetical protein
VPVVNSVRVYVPSSPHRLDEVVEHGLRPAPFLAHAVTHAMRELWPDGGEEEWEYAAAAAAAHASIGLLGPADAPRRVVVVADVPSVRPVPPVPSVPSPDDPTVVEVPAEVPFRRVAAVLADDDGAGEAVAGAVRLWSAAQAGDADAVRAVERCQDHELGWWATQETGELLTRLLT